MSNIFISSNEIAAIEGVIPVLGTDKSCCVLVSHLGGGAASVSKVMSSVRLAVGEAAAGIAKVFLPFSPPTPSLSLSLFQSTVITTASPPRAMLASLCHVGQMGNARTHNIACLADVEAIVSTFHNYSFGMVALKDVSGYFFMFFVSCIFSSERRSFLSSRVPSTRIHADCALGRLCARCPICPSEISYGLIAVVFWSSS